MPREFKTLFRLIRERQVTDTEAFNLAWAIFIALTGYRPQDEQDRDEPQTVYVRGFAPQDNE